MKDLRNEKMLRVARTLPHPDEKKGKKFLVHNLGNAEDDIEWVNWLGVKVKRKEKEAGKEKKRRKKWTSSFSRKWHDPEMVFLSKLLTFSFTKSIVRTFSRYLTVEIKISLHLNQFSLNNWLLESVYSWLLIVDSWRKAVKYQLTTRETEIVKVWPAKWRKYS